MTNGLSAAILSLQITVLVNYSWLALETSPLCRSDDRDLSFLRTKALLDIELESLALNEIIADPKLFPVCVAVGSNMPSCLSKRTRTEYVWWRIAMSETVSKCI